MQAIDDIDALKGLKADEQRAFDDWLEEVRVQRENQVARRPGCFGEEARSVAGGVRSCEVRRRGSRAQASSVRMMM
jgi:hypothetical protein